MKKLSKLEKEAIRKVTSDAGKASASKLSKKERIARARAAGIASGKARGKNVQKKDLQSGGKI